MNAYNGDFFNLIVGRLEGWHDILFDPLDKTTAILVEALQELGLEVFLSNQVRLALLLAELLDRSRDDVILIDLGGTHLL